MTEANKPKVGDTWYRYEDRLYGSANEFDEVTHTYVKLQLTEFVVTKVTPKGVWVSAFGCCIPRFVLLSANKRHALPTKEDALESLMARKARQIRILESQMKHAREATALAERERAKLKPVENSIPVELEDADELSSWGLGLEKVTEQCVFCGAGTRYWHTPTNNPVCQCCATIKTVDDLVKLTSQKRALPA